MVKHTATASFRDMTHAAPAMYLTLTGFVTNLTAVTVENIVGGA